MVVFYGGVNEEENYRLSVSTMEQRMDHMTPCEKENILTVRRRMERKYGKHSEEDRVGLEQYINKSQAKLDFALQKLKVICLKGSHFEM